MDDIQTEEVCYLIDPGQSRFTVQAFAEGLFSSFGHNPTIAIRDFNGKICLNPATIESASLELIVKPDVLSVTDSMSDKDRAEIERATREDVLETSRYPEISYRSQSATAHRVFEGMYRVQLNGELSLHGVTRAQPIEAQVTISGDLVRARGDWKLKQTDYKIRPVSVAGGTLKVKDELKLAFEIVGVRKA